MRTKNELTMLNTKNIWVQFMKPQIISKNNSSNSLNTIVLRELQKHCQSQVHIPKANFSLYFTGVKDPHTKLSYMNIKMVTNLSKSKCVP